MAPPRTAEHKLNDRMVARSDQCKRDVIAWNARRKEKAMSDVDIAQLQVIIGMAIRDAVLLGRSFERWNVTQPVEVDPRPPMPPRQATLAMCVPAVLDTSKGPWDDDATTEVMPPRKQ